MRSVYMDHSATTPVKPEVVEAMLPYFTEIYGNASSVHAFGREARKGVMSARNTIAEYIGASVDELFFTAGGTESDNWAIRGVAHANKQKGNHIITTTIEHHAVLHVCEMLEKEGFEVTYLKTDADGLISLKDLEAAIQPSTILISIMAVNNEIGTIQPIEEIGQIAKKHGVLFHTDAVQALGKIELDVNKQNIDLMSFSAHKLYGPKGIGALYVRKGTRIKNLMDGGAQEKKRRPGTENVPGIIGFGKAVELAAEGFEENNARLIRLRDKMIAGIEATIPYIRLNGHRTKRHPGNVNFCFEFIEGESLLLSLDLVGIAASSGSACTSGSLDPSHVLMAIGLTHEIAHGSLRLSLGEFTTDEDVDYVIEQLKPIVERLRSYSPLYEKATGGTR
ncbi:cysteine desulfurase NifS [Acidaminobacter hydrogenoformans]|uniref:Cysteine desulfurase IscS n=1 Tax=Acidaminobacter hydrogenoformans DSM 2784 TaxID=1120920 RepID=A0A1G5S6C8_9FIRM|nr:cysteine desulfurase NifS [Acidaminobacter hydrogenoformans]SCZ81768.1 cysteine desulfurase [Acidaminobacter hydrogenoformans DSM 2784]